MHIEELMQMVTEDVGVKLRRDMVDWESCRTPQLHQKYRKLLYFEKVELERMKLNMEPLLKERRIYYGGKDTAEGYKVKGLFQDKLETKASTAATVDRKQKQVIKSELAMYVDADPSVIAARELISQQAQKVEYLTDTLASINLRSFHLSTILNTQRFKAGLDNLNQVLEILDPDASIDE